MRGDESEDIDHKQRPRCYERVFADLKELHGIDHPKGETFYRRVAEQFDNISVSVCKLFINTCRRCCEQAKKKKPTAGVKNIVTKGFGLRGQVDLVYFQSMPDGKFKFLLNYVDHGIKKLTCIPIIAKRASTVALALLTIFTEQGPPMILQADNGREFYGSARTSDDHALQLDENGYIGGVQDAALEVAADAALEEVVEDAALEEENPDYGLKLAVRATLEEVEDAALEDEDLKNDALEEVVEEVPASTETVFDGASLGVEGTAELIDQSPRRKRLREREMPQREGNYQSAQASKNNVPKGKGC
eukprot:g3173.t1 g3173   contig12:1561499-1563102(+)